MGKNGKVATIRADLRNRVIGMGEEAPDQLLANPANFRIHPDAQQQALAGSIDGVGWIDPVIVNRLSGHVVDGHLRVTLALRSGVKSIPVVYVELSDAEEQQALLSLDPIAAMAATDKAQLDALLRAVQSDDERVQALCERVAIQAGLMAPANYDEMWQGMPEFEQEDLQGIIIRVHFENEDDRDDFAKKTGLNISSDTNSVWYPERPDRIKNQLGTGMKYTE
jgi:hypothetical protein